MLAETQTKACSHQRHRYGVAQSIFNLLPLLCFFSKWFFFDALKVVFVFTLHYYVSKGFCGKAWQFDQASKAKECIQNYLVVK